LLKIGSPPRSILTVVLETELCGKVWKSTVFFRDMKGLENYFAFDSRNVGFTDGERHQILI
jgi:hypothetical protein